LLYFMAFLGHYIKIS